MENVYSQQILHVSISVPIYSGALAHFLNYCMLISNLFLATGKKTATWVH